MTGSLAAFSFAVEIPVVFPLDVGFSFIVARIVIFEVVDGDGKHDGLRFSCYLFLSSTHFSRTLTVYA